MPQALRGCGLILSIVPITVIALSTLPPERVKNASGLFNLMRNLGGAVGLAVINTLLDERRDFHFARLAEAINWSRSTTAPRIAALTRHFQNATQHAALAALQHVAKVLSREAAVMAFADVFLVLTLMFVAAAALSLTLRKLGTAIRFSAEH